MTNKILEKFTSISKELCSEKIIQIKSGTCDICKQEIKKGCSTKNYKLCSICSDIMYISNVKDNIDL